MRRAFVKSLIELAQNDERICLLTGDLGFKALEEFAQRFPDRFINCGISEQNMAGMAAGLALSGKKPYIYSIAPFITIRCLEQIRNDICYQNLDVKIIGVGGGFSYGSLGGTHSLMQDVAILRSLPNMTVLCPADLLETEELMIKSHQTSNPTYIRTIKAGDLELHKEKPSLSIGDAVVLKEGKDAAIISSGLQSIFCLQVAEELKDYNLKVINVHTIKPINKDLLLKQLEGIDKIIIFEEHSNIGGLGSAILEILSDANWTGKKKLSALPDEFSHFIGRPEYMRERYQIDKEGVKKNILKFLN